MGHQQSTPSDQQLPVPLSWPGDHQSDAPTQHEVTTSYAPFAADSPGHHQSLPLNWPLKSGQHHEYMNVAVIVLAALAICYLVRKCIRKLQGVTSVTFAFHHETKDGEEIMVVGNVAELGGWDTNQAAAMKLIRNKIGDPIWTLKVDLTFSPEQPLEYKYVLMKCEGGQRQLKEWEPCMNRVLREKTAEDGGALILHNSWGGHIKDCKDPFLAGQFTKTVDCMSPPLTHPLIGG